MFVLVVTAQVKPEGRQDFIQAALDDARSSLRDEPGCLRFDVLADQQDPGRFQLYEVYLDQAAFDAHLRSPQLALFRQATAELYAQPIQARRCTNLFPEDAEWR